MKAEYYHNHCSLLKAHVHYCDTTQLMSFANQRSVTQQ